VDDDVFVGRFHGDFAWMEMRNINHDLKNNQNDLRNYNCNGNKTARTWNDLSSSLTLEINLPTSRSMRRIDGIIVRGITL
jgi:hypothetical protein